MNWEEFTCFVEKVIKEDIPDPLLQELHMGIIVLPEEKLDKHEGDQYIMGEYISNEMGNHIVLYYGSFAALFTGEDFSLWQKEIRDTIKHEVWHHVEALSGDEQLAMQEMLEEERKISRGKRLGSEPPSSKLLEIWKKLKEYFFNKG